jgi:hypothetical protein
MSTMTSVAGVVTGAGLMYQLDPVAGSRRRTLARDQLGHARRRVTEATGTILRDAQNRGRGLWATLVRELRPGDVRDHVLEDRVRSRLGTLVRCPGLVHVRCENGNVFLDGVVARAEVAHAVRRIRGMHGVDRVENRLELRADPAELPGAQSPIPDLPRDPRPDLTLRRLSPSERAEGVALGGGLLLDGVRRGGLSGAALGIAGLLILFGALTNKPLAERFTRRERRERVATRTALPAATEPTRPPLWSRA